MNTQTGLGGIRKGDSFPPWPKSLRERLERGEMNRIALRHAIDASALTKSQKAVLHYLVSLNSPSIHVGIARTAKRMRLDERTVRRAFRRLEDCGILILVSLERDGRIPRVYDLARRVYEKLPRLGANVPGQRLGGKCPPLSGGKCPRITRAAKSLVKLRLLNGGAS